ncbi:MAG: hypothetical protein B6244_06785 [Candidatus Cloacimonetes bacterium 4572_55]|nr:MAG: hypothetical protein B6244_06785 [Candidatus Cloacimonetes bacterium 4572_55]
MEIQEITLEGFKRFKSDCFQFKPGLNCIYGLNEAGKSTLLSAIRALFFGAISEEVASWASSDICLAQLVYRTDQDRVFTLQRNFSGSTVALTTDARAQITDARQVKQTVANHLGFGDGSFFEDIAFVRQTEIARLKFPTQSSNPSDFLPGLDRLINARKSIRKQLDDLDNSHPNVKNIRELQKNQRLLVEKEAQYQEGLAKFDHHTVLERELGDKLDSEADLKVRIGRYERNQTALRKARENQIRSAALEDDLSQLESLYDLLHEMMKDQERYAAELSELKKYDFPEDFEVRADFLIAQFNRLEEAADVHAKVRRVPNRTIDIVLWLIALAFFTASGFTKETLFMVSGLAVIAIWAYIFIRRSAALGAQQAMLSFEKDRALFLDQLHDLSDRFKDIDEADPNFIKIRSRLEDMQRDFRRTTRLKKAGDEVHIRWEQTVIQLPPIAYESDQIDAPTDPSALLDMLAERKRILKEEIDELTHDNADSLDSMTKNATEEDMQQSLEELREQMPQLQEERIRLEKELESSAREMREWEGLESEIHLLRAEVERILHQVGTLRKADQGIQETIDQLGAFPELNEKISAYFQQMTEDQYERVRFRNSGEKYCFSVHIPEVGEEMTPEEALSQGAIEQFYLAFRLALIDRYPSPLFLDDALVNFDHKRRNKTLRLLNQLAKQRQIFITTHEPAILKMLRKVAHINALSELP